MKVAFTHNLRLTDVRETEKEAEYDSAETVSAIATVIEAAGHEVEKVEVSDADVQKKLAELAAARQENVKKLRADLEKSGRIHGLRRQIQDDKTLDLLLAQAKIADVSAEEVEDPAEAPKSP